MTTYTFDSHIVSDLYKDAYGFRPSSDWSRSWTASSNDEKQSMWDNILRAVESSIDEDARNEAWALENFEERIKATINLGAGNEKTAIRWILDGMDLSEIDRQYGGEYICFTLGLNNREAHRFEEFCN